MQNLSHLIEQTEEKAVSSGEHEEELVESPRKRPRKLKSREQPTDVVSVKELFLQHPTEFWELFEATRKMVDFLKGAESISSLSCVTSSETDCDPAVSKFLDSIEMSKYKTLFAKFSIDVMKSLNAEELTRFMSK
ncbi:hypothetical protein KIN20_017237 [Parelaphostrongylus tenuis]|uniref:Uncharacterized protein n=1 Tax=Parelaphostrongylus tenuis TaxID=148309 RepID=A0AAD5QRC4_PARTN|nr:hypothetical protein KIN20_017237 [Parelaphostrongylus tenuis]